MVRTPILWVLLDLVEQFLKCVGISSLHDSSLFRKDFIVLDQFESLLPALEPYYHPCKASEFIYKPLTLTSAVTILRQILKSHNASLILHEKETTTGAVLKTKVKFHLTEHVHLGIEYMNTYYKAPGPRNPNSDTLRTNTDVIFSVGFSY